VRLSSIWFEGNAPAADSTVFYGNLTGTVYYMQGATGWGSTFGGRPAEMVAISWTPPSAITYGTPLSATQLDASGSMSGALVYTPPLGTVLNAGTNTLSVVFTPTGNASFVLSNTVSLVVLQAVPVVTWPALSSIAYGAALSSNQLNATANLPGSFAYTPPLGAVPNAGSNALSVIFTPNDAADYASVTDVVGLAVSPVPLTVTATNVSRVFGQANPVFGGAITGLTNGDNITAAYSCSATTNSPAGIYPVIPSLVDPNNRQSNYSVNLVNGALTVISAPYATTLPATAITGSTANLNGVATPNFSPATVWFQWGTNENYGNQTPATCVTGGLNPTLTSATLTGLMAGLAQPYYFRLVASNGIGVTYGAGQAFGVDKRIWAWGCDDWGQTTLPNGLSNVIAVAGGGFHSLALKTDGTVAAWGDDYYGQTDAPAGLSNVAAIAAGYDFSLALLTNGACAAWGDNASSQTNVPGALESILAIAAGDSHGLALQSNGIVAAWGANDAGQSAVPAGLSNVVAIAAGGSHNLALQNNGAVIAWGDNAGGETNVPPGLRNVVAIAAGLYHCVALQSNGAVVVWGDNSYGQTNVPAGATNIVAIAAARLGCLAMRSDGALIAWGDNTFGETNIPSNLANPFSIAGGAYHNFALTADNPPSAGSETILDDSGSNCVITLPASDPDDDALTLRLVSLPSAGALYQYAANGPGSLISLTNTCVTDLSNRVIFAPVPGTWGAPCASFQFVASDGLYDSTPATITINVAALPTVATLPAPQVTCSNALLNGCVSPNSLATAAWFQWGATTNYGNVTSNLALGSGAAPLLFSNGSGGLAPLTLYHCRAVATNALGIAFGNDLEFSTTVAPFSLSGFGFESSGAFHIRFSATPAARFSLWASTNLSNWVWIGASIEDLPGVYEAGDPSATNGGVRFYQLRWP
jgi:hypothetical protein